MLFLFLSPRAVRPAPTPSTAARCLFFAPGSGQLNREGAPELCRPLLHSGARMSLILTPSSHLDQRKLSPSSGVNNEGPSYRRASCNATSLYSLGF